MPAPRCCTATGCAQSSTLSRRSPICFPPKRRRHPASCGARKRKSPGTPGSGFLDYLLALESLEQYHAGFHRLKGADREDSFLIGYAALLAKYRAALEFIARADHNPELDKVLNEPVPEIGLPAGTYAKLKFKYLNVAIATEFAAHEVMLKTFSGNRRPALRQAIAADADFIWKTGRAKVNC